MKTIFKSAMLIASALVVFSSCLKEQTALSIEDIPGTAKVMGTLTYNEGQAYEGGKFVELKKVAAGVEVVVKVFNDDLTPADESSDDPNVSVTGYTDYSTITDENGAFEIEVPAVDNGVKYKIFAPSFEGVKKELKADCWKGGEPVFDEAEGVFVLDDQPGSMTLKPGSISVEKVAYSFKPFAQEKVLPTYVTLIVEAGIGVCVQETVTDNNSSQSYKRPSAALEYAKGIDVVVQVTYGEDYDGEVRYYGGTTGSDGTFELEIPATSEDMKADIQLQAREFVGEEDFTYYTYNDDRTGTVSHDITGGLYTFVQFDTAGCGERNFEFFTPVASVTMQVGSIVSGADEDGLYFESYFDYGWSDKWDASKLGVEE